MKYSGACHCGSVTFAFEADVDEIVRCDCSLCSKRNALMVTVHREHFNISRGQDALRVYRWNSGVARHYFCGTCGIYVYHQRRSNPALLSVNACSIDGLDRETLPTRQVDGKSRSVVETTAAADAAAAAE
ncbi:GFA family protein [Rhodoferax sp. OV413]|uniref:GFA family protein n=1 Tax=Rhodoferax sp. OV413 TaxID=1855285 RepID=UPI000B8298DF|nr:GFA family protein [Rhodoferax sp. OV413]